MHHTGKKESKKEILKKKKKKKKRYEKLTARGFEPGPSESVTITRSRLCPLDHRGKHLQTWLTVFKDDFSFLLLISV